MKKELRSRNIDGWRADFSTRGFYDEDGQWQGGLYAFVKHFWHILEPETPFDDGWALVAICMHLEAVTFGEIKRLLINVPPGFCKSLLTDVFWPAWEWGPMNMAHLRYCAFSYSSSLTERDNDRFKDLITSEEYREMYPHVHAVKVGAIRVSNTKKGWKLASSVGGTTTGQRGDRIILDDPHNVKEAESELVRNEAIRWFRESMSNRLNSPKRGAIVVIMQRVNENDVSGEILENELPYVHLMIPMEYDSKRQTTEDGEPITTAIGWYDPRYNEEDPEAADGELAWIEHCPPEEVDAMRIEVGPFAWAAQYQQTPEARGGGIIKREFWQLWEGVNGKFPPLEFILASLDSAFTEDEQNDPSAMTVWGIFKHQELNERRIILLSAWRKRLQFHGPVLERLPKESDLAYLRRSQPTWGLIEWSAHTCRRFQADLLLIEGKASGISAAQELRRLYGNDSWGVMLAPVKGDKVARALAAQSTFSKGMVYAPDRDWAQMVIDEAAVFPKGRYKDLTDSTTQAIKYLRDNGLAQTDDEVRIAEHDAVRLKKKSRPLYPV